MVAIEIRINGTLEATCGADDLRQLVAMVAARRAREADAPYAFMIECLGVRSLNPATDEVLKWMNARIVLGDEVSFKVVEVTQAQEPIDRQDISARAPSED